MYAYRKQYRRESVKFNIEGLCSLKTLHLGPNTDKVDISIKNLLSLINLSLSLSGMINDEIITRLLDQVPHIKETNKKNFNKSILKKEKNKLLFKILNFILKNCLNN